MDAKNWVKTLKLNKNRIIREGIKTVSAAANLNLRFIVGIDVGGNTYAYNAPKYKEINPNGWTGNTCDLFIVTPDYINIPEKVLKSHFELAIEDKIGRLETVKGKSIGLTEVLTS